MGIPVTEQGNLFRRFSRLDSARASQIRGTGLGLYICRQIMRAMDGDVWLQESTPGEGSAFAFTLPAAEPQDDELLPVKTVTSAGRLAAND
jgi:signal transduction histidine kinase